MCGVVVPRQFCCIFPSVSRLTRPALTSVRHTSIFRHCDWHHVNRFRDWPTATLKAPLKGWWRGDISKDLLTRYIVVGFVQPSYLTRLQGRKGNNVRYVRTGRPELRHKTTASPATKAVLVPANRNFQPDRHRQNKESAR